MTNDAMIGALRSYMAHNDHVSFAELTNRIPGANGDRAYGVLDLNVCFWPGLSPELAEALNALLKAGEIHLKPTNPFIYLYDGAFPRLLIARRIRSYKTLRWLPTVIRPGAGPAPKDGQTRRKKSRRTAPR